MMARFVCAATALVLLSALACVSHAKQKVRGEMLVTTGDLAKMLRDPSLVLIHVGTKEEYDAGHIPGAQFLDRTALSTPRGEGLTLELPPVEQLERAFEAIGVGDRSRVVVYFGNDWVTPTARVLFTLDYLGLGDRAAMLDGGMPAWKAEGRPVTAEVTTPKPGNLTPRPRKEIVVDAAWVKANGTKPSVALLDARTGQFYDGSDTGGMPRGGHIPGAKSVPFVSLIDEPSGKLKSPEALREIFAAAGAASGDTVVSYCHIGQQASLVYFVARYLSYEVRLYDGSFQEWSAREDLPVEGAR
jgi:thiosulfate/3-mercaptopyruvate sulfurtransferase